MITELKKLHLHDYHAENHAKFSEFAGWEMPLSYGSSLDEHNGVRSDARVFDVSHMGQLKVSGHAALKFLNYYLTNDLSKCEVGFAQYSLLCNEKGGVMDDLIVYRLSKDEFMLCVNASNVETDFAYLEEKISEYDCAILDLSNNFGLLAIQGPSAIAYLSKMIEVKLSKISKMGFFQIQLFDEECIVARTGYTGEDGFEIYCPNQEIFKLAELCQKSGLKWAGLAARDSLRLEAGFPLHGHELSDSISPIQAKLGWAVGWNKHSFVGDQALHHEKESGAKMQVEHYEVVGRRIPRSGSTILDSNGTVAGKVLSGGFSPVLSKPIGTCLIDKKSWDNCSPKGWRTFAGKQEVEIIFGKPALRKVRDQKK
jgi:aminomethyltransferase